MPGSIGVNPAPGGGSSFDTSDLVTNEDPRLLPQRLDDSPDVTSGQTKARFDLDVWDESTQKWTRLPYAIWSDATKLGLAYNGSGGGLPLSMTTTSFSAGTAGAAYTTTVAATGGLQFASNQYTWTLSGSLPSGLAMAPTTGNKGTSAVISGTLAGGSQGTYAITVTATDARGDAVSLAASIIIVASGGALAISTITIPPAVVGQDYSFNLAQFVTGGTKFTGSETAGHQSTAHYHYTSVGNAGSATLPNKKILLDANGTVTGTAGMLYSKTVAWGGVLAPPDSVVVGMTVGVTVTDSLAASVEQQVTMNINSAQPFPAVDIADLRGASTYAVTNSKYPAGHAVDPDWNASQIASRAAQVAALTPQGRVSDSAGTSGSHSVIMIGAAVGATVSPTLVSLGNLNNFNLPFTDFKLAELQPANVPENDSFGSGLQRSCGFEISGATAPQVYINYDGNAANQYGGSSLASVNKGVSTSNPTWGFYQTGVRFKDCGPIAGTVIAKNVRGVKGNTSKNASGSGIFAETFHFQNLRGSGGDQLIVYVLSDDGSDKSNSSSGAVWQYQKSTSVANAALVVGVDVRHGAGCFAGGYLVIDTLSTFTRCGHAMNFEAGLQNAFGAVPTTRVQVGQLGAGTAQVTSTDCDMGMSLNGNNSGANGNTSQLGVVTVYGWTSTRDGANNVNGVICTSGTAPTGAGITFVDFACVDPAYPALHFQTTNGSANHLAQSAKMTLTTSTIHSTTASAYSAATTYASGDYATSSGILYRSLAGSNLNHAPASSPSFWRRMDVLPGYSNTTGTLTLV